MALKGWLLLVVFLLMQAGTAMASVCRPGAMGAPESGAACASAQCCCSGAGDSAPACACLEDPAGNEQPAPVAPAPSGGGRDLLPSVVWVEARPWVRPMRTGFAPAANAFHDRWRTVHAAAPLALTVRYCAFLI